jgi:hypothetical protein
MRAVSFALAALLLSACNLPKVMPEALNTEFKPTGEILLYNRSASWDAYRVRSPKCNLARRTDGSWGGVMVERPVDVSVTDRRISGVDLMLTRELSDDNKLVITGQFQGRIYRFELGEQRALFRAPNNAFTLDGRTPGEEMTTYGPRGDLQLKGEAGSDDPPWPQIGFALMAMMN